jgi:phage-related protein (TIGR01555 family)
MSTPETEQSKRIRKAAVYKAQEKQGPTNAFFPPELPAGVVPKGRTAAIAMDDAMYSYSFVNNAMVADAQGFPGYARLAQLMTRAEYRQFAATLSTELTREWITFDSTQDNGDESNGRIVELRREFERLKIRNVFQLAASQECFFGRAQFFINIKDADRSRPLILSPKTIKQGSLESITAVEAMWTSPSAYNAIDPAAPDFYKPTTWFMLGQEVHASRLLTVVTRPVPDMLKPSYNFSGMSLSQLAEPYVNNWLRTRQSVADLVNNFSITALATSMDQVLNGDSDGSDIFDRADLFTATRSNRGMMLLDKEREELLQVNTPLSGLHELQAQAQEHMCAVSRIPAVILTGISPSGLNATSEGEVRAWYDWVAAQQEAYWRNPLEIITKIVMLHLWGEIDESIVIKFKPLWQMSTDEEANIRIKNAQADSIYVDRGILDPTEIRQRLAQDPDSGYKGLEVDEVHPPAEQPDAFAEFDNDEDKPKPIRPNDENLKDPATYPLQ